MSAQGARHHPRLRQGRGGDDADNPHHAAGAVATTAYEVEAKRAASKLAMPGREHVGGGEARHRAERQRGLGKDRVPVGDVHPERLERGEVVGIDRLGDQQSAWRQLAQ